MVNADAEGPFGTMTVEVMVMTDVTTTVQASGEGAFWILEELECRDELSNRVLYDIVGVDDGESGFLVASEDFELAKLIVKFGESADPPFCSGMDCTP